MNTSELLVLIFVFLVGYMLYKMCGCIEGMKIPVKAEACEIDGSISKYIDKNKIKKMNGKLEVTDGQCNDLKSLVNNKPITMCNDLGGQGENIFV